MQTKLTIVFRKIALGILLFSLFTFSAGNLSPVQAQE